MKILIPDSFRYPPFYQKDTTIIEYEQKNCLADVYFYEDICGETGMSILKYERAKVYLDLMEKEEGKLTKCYEKRRPNDAKPIMVKLLAAFIEIVFWTNGKRVTGLENVSESIQSLTYKPVNCTERLAFIQSAPEQYHSYIQLKALFNEMKKIYSKQMIFEKRKK